MAAEPERQPLDGYPIQREVARVVDNALRRPFGERDPLLDVPDPADAQPTEYEPFPPPGDALTERGRRFLEGLGFPMDNPDLVYTYDTCDGDELMQIRIGNISDQDTVAETSLIVTLKGEQAVASLAAFLKGGHTMAYLLNPAGLRDLEDGELLNMIEEADVASSRVWMMDEYDVPDNLDVPTVEGAMHVMMDLAHDLAPIARVSIAEPLMAVTLSTRQKRPHRGDRRVQQFILTQGMPESFDAVRDIFGTLDESQQLMLRMDMERLEAETQRLLSERRIDVPITLSDLDVWIDPEGNMRLINLTLDVEELAATGRLGGEMFYDGEDGDDGVQV